VVSNSDLGAGNTPFSSPHHPGNDHDERLGPRPYTTIKTSLPFAYIGGKFLLTTAQYDASAISQMSFQAAVSIMSSGTDPVSRHAEAAAGYLAADFCALTRDQPTSVCSQVPSSLTGISASPGK